MRVRSTAITRRSRHVSASQRALLLDLPGNEQLSPAVARAISGGSVYKWRVFIYRSMKKACTHQDFMSLTEATKYILEQEHDSATPIKRIYLEAINP